MSDNPQRTDTAFNALYYAGMAALALLAAGNILTLLVYKPVMDDGYMFVRYADHIIHHGAIAWNPGGPPTYGLTSLFYLASVVPFRLLTPAEPTASAIFPSLFWGMVFLALSVLTLRKMIDTTTRTGKALFLFLLACLGYATKSLTYHFTSGMDTTFDLCYMSLYILVVSGFVSRRSAAWAVAAGVMGGLAWWARPDLWVYTFLVPAVLLAFGSVKGDRRPEWLLAGVTLLSAALVIVVTYLYFKTPVPLSFYAKGTLIYGENMVRTYRATPEKQLIKYVIFYWRLMLVVGVAVFIAPGWWLKKQAALDLGLMAASILFVGYYLFFVLQIMPNSQRFYYPTLPALLYLAAGSGARVLEVRKGEAVRTDPPIPGIAWLVILLLMLGEVLPVTESISSELKARRRLDVVKTIGWKASLMRVDMEGLYMRLGKPRSLFRLGEFSALPDDLVIAATEVGILGALNPEKKMVDLTGLHEMEFAKNGFDPDRLFDHYKPDLIYMPHQDYKRMLKTIKDDPRFKNDYDYYPYRLIARRIEVAIRKDSPYYSRMKAIADEGPDGIRDE